MLLIPTRPATFRAPGQPTPQQARQQHDRQRGTASQRGYGAPWNKFAKQLKKNPEFICCQVCGRLVDVIDHIIAVDGPDDPRFFQVDQLQPLCTEHHASKSARHDRLYGREPDTSPAARQELAEWLAAAAERAAAIDARQAGL